MKMNSQVVSLQWGLRLMSLETRTTYTGVPIVFNTVFFCKAHSFFKDVIELRWGNLLPALYGLGEMH